MLEGREVLFEAIKSVLDNTVFNLDISQYKAFYRLAKENGLSGMIYKVLNKEKLSQEVYLRFEKDFFMYNFQHEKQVALIKKIDDLMNENQIEHIFLKGVSLKAYYPESYMRSMGDIDVLVKEDKIKLVREVFENHQIKLTGNSTAHDNYEDLQGLSIEVHPRISRDVDDRFDSLSDHAWNESFIVENSRYQLNVEYEICYLLVHLVKHFYSSGVGLRSILDIGLFVKENQEIINENRLIEQLNQFNLDKFFLTIMYLNKLYFSIDAFSNLQEDYQLKDSTLEALTEYILVSGIHGHGVGFNRFIGRLGGHHLQKKKRISLIISIVFPSYKDMSGMYPWLRRMPLLYPFTWVVRWFKIMVLKFGVSLKKIRSLFTKSQEVEKVSKMYEEIGL